MSAIFDTEASAPVSERIVDVVCARIAEANIYNAKVVRPDREGRNLDLSDSTIMVHQRSMIANQEATHEGNPIAQAYDLLLHLQCFVRNQNQHENAYSAACNRLAAEVVRAITQPITDPALWYQFDGLALNARIGAQIPFSNEKGTHAGVVLPLSILFRVSENNHYEVRT